MRPLRLSLDARGRLVLKDEDGLERIGVEVVRGFPITSPRTGIAILDDKGRELAWIADLDRLEPTTRELLEVELSKREFMPIVTSVLHVSGMVEPTEWEVETDRGRTTFVLNSEDDVHRLGENRAMIFDAHGTRYLLSGIEAMDARSRRLLERYL